MVNYADPAPVRALCSYLSHHVVKARTTFRFGLIRFIKRVKCMRESTRIAEYPVYVKSVSLELGRRIGVLRHEKQLSQTRLGELVGISFQQVQKYERGINQITVSRLIQFSLALEVPLESLLKNISEHAHENKNNVHSEKRQIDQTTNFEKVESAEDASSKMSIICK